MSIIFRTCSDSDSEEKSLLPQMHFVYIDGDKITDIESLRNKSLKIEVKNILSKKVFCCVSCLKKLCGYF